MKTKSGKVARPDLEDTKADASAPDNDEPDEDDQPPVKPAKKKAVREAFIKHVMGVGKRK